MKNLKFDVNQVVEIRTATLDYFGVGAIQKINNIAASLSQDGIKKVLVVCCKNAYLLSGAWDVVEPALKENGISFALYNKVAPNPTDTSTDEATTMGREFGAQAVIGIGGGSPIDVAKSVAIMLEYPDFTTSDLYQFKFTPTVAKPIVAINTTHGTGTEVNRFAVVTVTEKDYKPAIAYDCIYPKYAIDDPALMVSLPALQTLYVSIDAVNHVTEAATTLAATPYSVMMAKETIELVHEFLPKVMANPKDLEARYYLTFASALAGISFDNGLLHFTHALEHPLSAIKPELAHGLGLSMILPAVIKAIYAAKPEVLAEIYAPIIPNLKGVAEEAEAVAKGIENWLIELGVTQKLEDEGFSAADIDRLVELTFETPSLDLLLSMAPIKASKETIRAIYTESLKPIV